MCSVECGLVCMFFIREDDCFSYVKMTELCNIITSHKHCKDMVLMT